MRIMRDAPAARRGAGGRTAELRGKSPGSELWASSDRDTALRRSGRICSICCERGDPEFVVNAARWGCVPPAGITGRRGRDPVPALLFCPRGVQRTLNGGGGVYTQINGQLFVWKRKEIHLHPRTFTNCWLTQHSHLKAGLKKKKNASSPFW